MQNEIFSRQFGIEEIGEQGQAKLSDSSVLVIGCGGLGSPAITYLTSAGVGTIFVADGDIVEPSNLNRQFLHTKDDVGKNKARNVATKACALNGASTVIAIDQHLSGELLAQYVAKVDCVIDCVDTFKVRREVGRACLQADVPLVEAGVSDLYGWLLCIDATHACLECAGMRDVAPSTSPTVLGALAGMVGSAQALECIKILLGSPDVGFGKLVNFDGRRMEIETISIAVDPTCKAHSSPPAVDTGAYG